MQSKIKVNFKVLIFFLGIGWKFPAISWGEEKSIESKDGYACLDTPYDTIVTHTSNVGRYKKTQQNFYLKLAAKAFAWENITQLQAQTLAIKLKKILDHKGIYIQIEQIPKDPYYESPKTKELKYILDKRVSEIYLVKKGSCWVYSKETITSIDRLYRKVYRFKIDSIGQAFPLYWQKHYGSLALWQYLVFIVGTLSLFLFYGLFHFLLTRLAHYFLPKQGLALLIEEKYMAILAKVISPLSKAFIGALIFIFFLPCLQLPAGLNLVFQPLNNIMSISFFAVSLYQYINFLDFYITRRVRKGKLKFPIEILPFFRKLLKTLIFISTPLFILVCLHINVNAFLAGFSLSSLGVALASQDMLRNLFGSFMIFLDHPFSIHDYIILNNVQGAVEEIGLRSTRIRTNEQSTLYIPNANLASASINNLGHIKSLPSTFLLAFPHLLSHEKLSKLLDELKLYLEEHTTVNSKKSHMAVRYDKGKTEIIFTLVFKERTSQDKAEDWIQKSQVLTQTKSWVFKNCKHRVEISSIKPSFSGTL